MALAPSALMTVCVRLCVNVPLCVGGAAQHCQLDTLSFIKPSLAEHHSMIAS